MNKMPFKERVLLISLIIAAVIFAIWLIWFSPLSKSSENAQKTDETEIVEEQPTEEESVESEICWTFGEETGVTGLIPLSCSKIKGIYTYTFYDAETGVMYYLVRDEINSATASGSGVLENPDGTPRIYAPYQKDSGN